MSKAKKAAAANRVSSPSSMQLKEVQPRTENQARVFNEWLDGYHLFLSGSAGTGKTFLALALGLQAVESRQFRKVIVIRSAVPARSLGFLPGGLEEKSEIFEEPLVSLCNTLYGRDDAYEVLRDRGIVDFQTTSYLRGVNLDNAVVVFDEVQNATKAEIDTVMTRLGENCRMILCGDGKQSDLHTHEMKFLTAVTQAMGCFRNIQFTTDDIVRSGFVKKYLVAKEKVGA